MLSGREEDWRAGKGFTPRPSLSHTRVQPAHTLSYILCAYVLFSNKLMLIKS